MRRRARREGPDHKGGDPQQNGTRIDALDGLRAFAIASVVLYHLNVPWLPSGHMCVVIFFVLTGFFVTVSARRTFDGRGISGLARLWRHRFVRIWPPMAFMILVVTALCVLFNHILLTKERPDIVPSLLFYPNLSYILRGASYFDQIGGTSPLTHLWYLGVDAQFCLLWPLLQAGLRSMGGRGSLLARIVVCSLAMLSALLMAILYDPNTDPTRVYYGTDTRAFAPLAGAWLALAWPLDDTPREGPMRAVLSNAAVLQIAGVVSLVAIVAIMAIVPDTSPFLYRGGMALVAIGACALLAALRTPGPLATAFGTAPMRWLASRSYALYLWHYPLFALFAVTLNTTPGWAIACAVCLSFAAAELTTRAGRALASDPAAVSMLASPPALGGCAATLAIAAIGLAVVPETLAVPEEAIVSTGVGAAQAMDLSSGAKGTDGGVDGSVTDGGAGAQGGGATSTTNTRQDLDDLPSGSITLRESTEAKAAGLYDPVMVGDSVPGDVADYFETHCPDGLLDSYVGRRSDQMEVVLNDYLEQGIVGNVVILEAFGNNVASDDELARMITACGQDRSIYLVNVRTTDGDQNAMNAPLERAAAAFGNVTLVDWCSASADHLDVLYADGTHIRPEGGPLYFDLINNAIKRDFAAAGGMVGGGTGGSGPNVSGT